MITKTSLWVDTGIMETLPYPDLLAIAVLKEREECAKLCDKQANDKHESDPWTGCASYLANEIRAKKKP